MGRPDTVSLFYRITEGIRVTAYPRFLAEHSDPDAGHYVFSYRIRLENVGERPAQLVWRHWHVHDPVAGDHEVEGEGVVGECPTLLPGGVYEYASFCVLRGPEGAMEGFYRLRRDDGSEIAAAIPRFPLSAPGA